MSEIVTSTLGSAAQPGSLLRDPTLSARSPSLVILRVRCRYATPSRAALTKAAVALRPKTWPMAAPPAGGAASGKRELTSESMPTSMLHANWRITLARPGVGPRPLSLGWSHVDTRSTVSPQEPQDESPQELPDLGGMPDLGGLDMGGLLAQAQQMQAQLMAATDELATEKVQGTAASGLVTATVTGTGELVSLDIRPEAVDPADVETLGDMVVAAIRDATGNATALAAERMGPLAGLGGGDPFGGAPGASGPVGFQ